MTWDHQPGFQDLLQEVDRRLVVAGFRNVEVETPKLILDRTRQLLGVTDAQLLNPHCIGGFRHLRYAAANTLMAFAIRRNIARSLSTETLLFAAAERQIDAAIRKLGLTMGSKSAVLLTFKDYISEAATLLDRLGDSLGWRRDDSIIEVTSMRKMKRLMALFNIPPIELKAAAQETSQGFKLVEDLILERIALSALRR